MSLQALIERMKYKTSGSEHIEMLIQAAEILYNGHKEIYADGSYKDIASEIAKESFDKADSICEEPK